MCCYRLFDTSHIEQTIALIDEEKSISRQNAPTAVFAVLREPIDGENDIFEK